MAITRKLSEFLQEFFYHLLARILTSGIKRYLYYLHFSISSPVLPASFDLLLPTKETVSRSHGFLYEEVQQKVAQT